jgi:phosphoglycolate phosphatase
MKQAVIFDLDGTLLNTIEDIHIAVNIALNSFGFKSIAISETTLNIGHGAFNLIKQILVNENLETVKKVYELYQHYYDNHLIIHTKPYDGIDNILKDLMSKGIKIGVVSNKHHYLVKKLVTHFFPKIIYYSGMKESIPIKPKPDMLLAMIEEMGVLHKDVFYIGDSEADILCAQASKVEMIALSYGYRSKRVLLDLNPNVILDSVINLKMYLKENV